MGARSLLDSGVGCLEGVVFALFRFDTEFVLVGGEFCFSLVVGGSHLLFEVVRDVLFGDGEEAVVFLFVKFAGFSFSDFRGFGRGGLVSDVRGFGGPR